MSNIVNKVIEKYYGVLTASEIAAAASALADKIPPGGVTSTTQLPNPVGDKVTITLNPHSPGYKTDNTVYANKPFMIQAIYNPVYKPPTTQPPTTQPPTTKPSTTQPPTTKPPTTKPPTTKPSTTQPPTTEPPTTNPPTTNPLTIQPPITPSNTPSPTDQQLQQNITDDINSLIESSGLDINNILVNIVTLTSGQPSSIAIPISDNLKNIFTNNPINYPLLNNSTVPLALVTTITDPITQLESINTSIIPSNTTLVIPSLTSESTIKMGGSYITRNKSNNIAITNKYSIYDADTGLLQFIDPPCSTCTSPTSFSTGLVTYSNSSCSDCNYQWYNVGSTIVIDNKSYQLSGIGSPILITPISNAISPTSNAPSSNPKTLLSASNTPSTTDSSNSNTTLIVIIIIILLVLIGGLIYYFYFAKRNTSEDNSEYGMSSDDTSAYDTSTNDTSTNDTSNNLLNDGE